MKFRLSEGDFVDYSKELNDARRIVHLVRFEYLDRFIKYKEMKKRFRLIMGLPETEEKDLSEVSQSLMISV